MSRVQVVAVHNIGKKGSLLPVPPKVHNDLVRLVCVSDTHSAHSSLGIPADADILVHGTETFLRSTESSLHYPLPSRRFDQLWF